MQFRIYRPNKQNNGAATKLEARYGDKGRVLCFWEVTQQTGIDDNGNAAFGWKDPNKTITFKLSTVDIGEILATINGRKKCVGTTTGKYKGIYHQTPTANTTFVLEKLESNYALKLSRQKNNEILRIGHLVSDSDIEIIRIFLWQALFAMFQIERPKNAKLPTPTPK